MYHIGIGKHVGIFMETYHAYFYIFTSFLSKQYRDLQEKVCSIKGEDESGRQRNEARLDNDQK